MLGLDVFLEQVHPEDKQYPIQQSGKEINYKKKKMYVLINCKQIHYIT